MIWNLFILIAGIIISLFLYKPLENTCDLLQIEAKKSLPLKLEKLNNDLSTITFPLVSSSTEEDLEKDSPVSNDKFLSSYVQEVFNIDDTDALRDQNLTCSPESLGYSKEKGQEVFPFRGYPPCSEVTGISSSKLRIQNRTLYMDCPGKFITGPGTNKKLIHMPDIYDFLEVKDYTGPVKLSAHIEFALGQCPGESEFMHADLDPVFNETAYQKAKESMSNEKPLIIFVMALDSLSRRQYFRKLPKLAQFVNELAVSSNFSVFDFWLHNILGDNSIANMGPFFGGLNQYVPNFRGPQNIDFLGNRAIWNKLRPNGFLNSFIYENCEATFPSALGKNPDIENLYNPFVCISRMFSKIDEEKSDGFVHQCLGPEMLHKYTMSYALRSSQINTGVNQFFYTHLLAAHESTGFHVETMDEDVTSFLKQFLRDNSPHNDIVFFLHADHGMRYGNWFKDPQAYQEHKLPMLFFISNTDFLKKKEFSFYNLFTNSKRLVSKMDLRKTVLHLGGSLEETEYGINLLEERAGKSRTCKEAGILGAECCCNELKEVYEIDRELENLLEQFKQSVQNEINSLGFSSAVGKASSICRKVNLGRIQKVFNTQLNKKQEFFKIEIGVEGAPTVLFQANVLISAPRLRQLAGKFPPEYALYKGFKLQYQVSTISRLDKIAGSCERRALEHFIKSYYCICEDLFTK